MTEEDRQQARQDEDEKHQNSQAQENASQDEPSQPSITFENDSVELAESDRHDGTTPIEDENN